MTSNLYEIVCCRDANNHEECLRENKTGINGNANCDLCLTIFFEEIKMGLAEFELEKTINLCDTCKNVFAICKGSPTFMCEVVNSKSIEGTIADRIIRCNGYIKKEEE